MHPFQGLRYYRESLERQRAELHAFCTRDRENTVCVRFTFVVLKRAVIFHEMFATSPPAVLITARIAAVRVSLISPAAKECLTSFGELAQSTRRSAAGFPRCAQHMLKKQSLASACEAAVPRALCASGVERGY